MKLGECSTTKDHASRDAFHVPCILARSRSPIWPGQSVRFTDAECEFVEPCPRNARHGVADTILECELIPAMTYFWVMLNPNLVQGLTHNFLFTGTVASPDTFATGELPKGSEAYDKPLDDEYDGCPRDCG